MPASKILLGLPLYGYVSQSTKTALTGSFMPPSLSRNPNSAVDPKLAPRGRNARPAKHTSSKLTDGGDGKAKSQAAADVNLQSWYGQEIPFTNIVSSGALVKDSDGNYGGSGGFTMGEHSRLLRVLRRSCTNGCVATLAWDDCSDTPVRLLSCRYIGLG